MPTTPEGRHRQKVLGGLSPAALQRQERQKLFLEMIRNGRTISQACSEVGIVRTTYQKWRDRHPGFRHQVDAIRVSNLDDLNAGFQGDFISFRHEFFGMDTYWHQREIVRAIEHAKPGEIVLINVPPEHGKTTVLEDWCNYKLALDPNFRITLVSEAQNHARKILGRVARRMTDTHVAPAYIARWGPFKIANERKPWSADFFRVAKMSIDERDYSMEARGWKSKIQGTRTDLLLIDDIQGAGSLNLSEKMLDVFRQDMLTRPGRDGRIVIVGTRVGQRDFYERLVEEEIVKPKNYICLPAMRPNDLGIMESLCPEMWPTDVLEERRHNVGEAVWWRTYMQAPKASMDATFTEDMLQRAYNLSLSVGQVPEWATAKVCGLDPALAGGNALHVAAYSADRYHVLEVDSARGLARVEAILERLERLAIRHRFEDLVVEDNAFQQGLGQDERLRGLARQYGFRIHTHRTGRNKIDEAIGVARMPISFIEERLTWPGASDEDRAAMEPLVAELRNWRADVPTRHLVQDQVMAMWFCWLFWQRKRAAVGANDGWHRQGTPWKPATYKTWNTNRGIKGLGAPRRRVRA